jgi:hypothetical protein
MEALTGQSNRALTVVQGRTLLDCVTTALTDAANVGDITVIGDVPPDTRYRQIRDQGDFVANVVAGAAAFPAADYVLVATSDLPFLTGAVTRDFVRDGLEKARQTKADILYPIVPVAECYARFPNVKRTSLRLREGVFTGGNLMLIRPSFLLERREWIAESYAARKSVLKIARLLGPGAILRLAVSQKLAPNLLTLAWLENRISRLIGATGHALICHAPELATDLDRPSDFEAVGLAPPAPNNPQQSKIQNPKSKMD